MLRTMLYLTLVVCLTISAGCVSISALEAPGSRISRPPEILLPGPYDAPQMAPASAPEASIAAPPLTSDHLRDLQIEARIQQKVISTSDILRGVYGPFRVGPVALPVE